jgi:hypothetical protein
MFIIVFSLAKKDYVVIICLIVFWVFPQRLSIKSRCIETLCWFHLQHFITCWRWNRHSVPKRRRLILRRRGNTQKTICHYNNTAKTWKLKLILFSNILQSFRTQIGYIKKPPETCRAGCRCNKVCNVASCWIYIGILNLLSSISLFVDISISSVSCSTLAIYLRNGIYIPLRYISALYFLFPFIIT